MTSTLVQMAILIGCGTGWRYIRPGGLDADRTRGVLTGVVYYLLLPAMVLLVLWRAEIGLQSLQYTLLGVACILFGMAAMWLIGRFCRFERMRLGATLLAAAFPNVTFLGLPVLEQSFGTWARSVAIQLDLFATGPLAFSVGVTVAGYYGWDERKTRKNWLTFFNAPPFWAAGLAVVLNRQALNMPLWLEGVLEHLAGGVVPLMLISLGLALNWQAVHWRNVPYILPVIAVKMALMPWFAMGIAAYLALDAAHKAAAVLEMAMPCMVMGVVFCDRYGLDTSLYAMAVTVTTVLSLLTLPFWYALLTA
ncbi:MAG: AEC family transporter [Gammaproteobacteria bacterium]